MTKISQINDRGAVVAWSPFQLHSDIVALGSKDSGGVGFDDYGGELEIYDCAIAGTQEPKLLGKVKTNSRFTSIDWSPNGFELGMIVGGMSDGSVQLWDAAGVISGNDDEGRVIMKHNGGAVTALAFNPHDGNMLASGSAGGQILITSLEDLSNPNVFPPSASPDDIKSTAEVTQISWNTQVAHIVAHASGNGTVVVWDLRQKKPWCELRCESIGGVSDIAWHPTEGLQLITASAEDSKNLMKLWDLRTSTTMALATLSAGDALAGGIFSCDWCPHDPALLMSCGKDNRTLIWDLYAMEPIYEIPNDNQQVEQVNSFNDVQNKLGASLQEKRYSSKWSPYRRGVISTCSFDRKVQLHSLIGFPNKGSKSNRTPQWLRGNTGVAFGFGGRLVSFGGDQSKLATLIKVVENPDLVAASEKFEDGIASGDVKSFCQQKIVEALDSYETQVWGFMQIIFESNARQLLLQYLGFDPDEIQNIANEYEQTDTAIVGESKMSKDDNTIIMQTLLVGNFEAAVDCCFKSGNMADALILASCGGAELWARAQAEFFTKETMKRPYLSLVNAVINNQLSELVQQSNLLKWRETLAILSTYGRSDEFAALCTELGQRLENEGQDYESASLCYMCALSLNDSSRYWKQLVEATSAKGSIDVLSLQSFVEKISIFCQADSVSNLPDDVSEIFALYARHLADQGLFTTALKYCKGNSASCVELMSRLYYGGGSACQSILATSPPHYPFDLVNVGVSIDAKRVSSTQNIHRNNRATRQESSQSKSNALPLGWHELQDPNSGNPYYYNEVSEETTWDRPPSQGLRSHVHNRSNRHQEHENRSIQVNPQSHSTSYQSKGSASYQKLNQDVGHQQQLKIAPSTTMHGGQSTTQPTSLQEQKSFKAMANTTGNERKTLASRYGDGFVTSASHPELAQQYGNVGTSNPYTGAPRPGTAVVSPMQKKSSPLSSNLSMDEIELSPENRSISDSLLNLITDLEKLQNLNSSEKKQLGESRKAINILVKKMCRKSISEDVNLKVVKLTTALLNRDFSAANSVQTGLVNSEWKDHKDWLRGSKLLIQLAAKKSQ